MKKIAIYPGSFDPITLGHMDMITRGCSVFDELYIAVAVSERKSPRYSLEQRMAMVGACINDVAKVQVIALEGLLVECAKQVGAQYLLRGLRHSADFDYESEQLEMNRLLCPEIETVFLAAGNSTRFISSTMVREILSLGRAVDPFVPNAIVDMV